MSARLGLDANNILLYECPLFVSRNALPPYDVVTDIRHLSKDRVLLATLHLQGAAGKPVRGVWSLIISPLLWNWRWLSISIPH